VFRASGASGCGRVSGIGFSGLNDLLRGSREAGEAVYSPGPSDLVSVRLCFQSSDKFSDYSTALNWRFFNGPTAASRLLPCSAAY
jgi:hypothetical protein